MAKTEEEIQDQIDKALGDPDKFPGMNYAEGVRAALEWILGINESAPMED